MCFHVVCALYASTTYLYALTPSIPYVLAGPDRGEITQILTVFTCGAFCTQHHANTIVAKAAPKRRIFFIRQNKKD